MADVPFRSTAAERFSLFVELAKDPATRPDLGAADIRSVNLASYDRRSKKVRGAKFAYQNSYETCRYFLERSREFGLRPSLQIFEPGFLRAAFVFLDQGLLSEPLILKFYLGAGEQCFGMPPPLKSLAAYLEMIRDVRCQWFAATLGGDNLPMVPLNSKPRGTRPSWSGGPRVHPRRSAIEFTNRRARRGYDSRYGLRGRVGRANSEDA